MAMRIGGENRVEAVGGRHWRRFAEANDLDPVRTVARVGELATRTPEGFAAAARDDAVQALGSDLPARLVERVAARAGRCRAALGED